MGKIIRIDQETYNRAVRVGATLIPRDDSGPVVPVLVWCILPAGYRNIVKSAWEGMERTVTTDCHLHRLHRDEMEQRIDKGDAAAVASVMFTHIGDEDNPDGDGAVVIRFSVAKHFAGIFPQMMLPVGLPELFGAAREAVSRAEGPAPPLHPDFTGPAPAPDDGLDPATRRLIDNVRRTAANPDPTNPDLGGES